MNSFLAKLNIYDVFGYIVPGFLGLVALNIFSITFFQKSLKPDITNQFVLAVAYLLASLYVGIVLHEISQIIEKYFFRPLWGGFLSERFLLDSNNRYSQEIKTKIKQIAENQYCLNITEYDKKKSQEIFNLFYSALQMKGLDGQAQIFNTQYGMLQNFFAGTLIITVVYLSNFIKIIVTSGYKCALSEIFFLVLGVLSLILLGRRLRRFGERFADYVIRDYLNVHTEEIGNK